MNNPIRGLPNLVIAGVHKAGTTSLYSYLAKHPEICPSHKKEIGYFGPIAFGRNPGPVADYAEHFKHCKGERYRLEASPSYLYGRDEIARAMHDLLGDIRVLIILRDPVDRLLSFYKRAISKSTLPADMTLTDYLNIAIDSQYKKEHTVYSRGIREGRYVDYLDPWRDIFGNNLRIVFFEYMKADAHKFTLEICDWLELDGDIYTPGDFSVENKTVQYRARGVHRLVREYYMKSEEFWRRNERLKKGLRKIYNRINAQPDDNSSAGDTEAIARLRSLYQESNSQLKSKLCVDGYDRFPDWID